MADVPSSRGNSETVVTSASPALGKRTRSSQNKARKTSISVIPASPVSLGKKMKWDLPVTLALVTAYALHMAAKTLQSVQSFKPSGRIGFH